jgi:hypothetical protein
MSGDAESRSEKPKKADDAPVMGRPRLEISRPIFEQLCMQQATKDDVAAVFQCSPDTIENRVREWYGEGATFSAISRELRKAGIVSLRQAGFRMARNNPIIHKFYMINYGGMKDTRHIQGNMTVENFQPGDEKKLTTEQLRRVRNGEALDAVLAETTQRDDD